MSDFGEYFKKIVIISLIFISCLCQSLVAHKLHSWAQHNKNLYKILEITDLVGFISSGGESFGYANQYKWSYARWLNNPKRTTIEKLLFWKVGILYDATNPPDEYQYPPLFKE
ncbi:MAG TPA: hypothetical protein PKZ16_01405 [bacterium]|nr:hypothetical protein [bacterium]HPL95210.1 hypothetical protein [bacterium]